MAYRLTFEEFMDSTNWTNVIDGKEPEPTVLITPQSQESDIGLNEIGEPETLISSKQLDTPQRFDVGPEEFEAGPQVGPSKMDLPGPITSLLDGAPQGLSTSLNDYFRPAKKLKLRRRAGNPTHVSLKNSGQLPSIQRKAGSSSKLNSKLTDLKSDPNIVVKIQNGKRIAPTTQRTKTQKKNESRPGSKIGTQPLYQRLAAMTDTFHSPRTLLLSLQALRDVFPVGDLSSLRDQIAVKIDQYSGFSVGDSIQDPMLIDGAADLDTTGLQLAETDESYWADCSHSDTEYEHEEARERLVVHFKARPVYARRQMLVRLRLRKMLSLQTCDGSGDDFTIIPDLEPSLTLHSMPGPISIPEPSDDSLWVDDNIEPQNGAPQDTVSDSEVEFLKARLQALKAQKRKTKTVSLNQGDQLHSKHVNRAGRRGPRKQKVPGPRLLYNKYTGGVGKKTLNQLNLDIGQMNIDDKPSTSRKPTIPSKVLKPAWQGTNKSRTFRVGFRGAAFGRDVIKGTKMTHEPESEAKSEPDAMLDGTNESPQRISATDFKKWKMRTPTWQQIKAEWEQDCKEANKMGIQAPTLRETPALIAQIYDDIRELMQGGNPQRDLPRTFDGPYSSSPEYSQTPWHDSKPLGLAALTQNRGRITRQPVRQESNPYEADAEISSEDESVWSEEFVLSPGEDELDIDDDFDVSYEYYVVRQSWTENQMSYSSSFGPFVYLEEANAQLCSAIFEPLKKMRITTGLQGAFEQEPDSRVKWMIQAGHMFISASIIRKQIARRKHQVNGGHRFTYLVHMATDDQMAAHHENAPDPRTPNVKVIGSFTRRSAANVFAYREFLSWLKARTSSEIKVEIESEFETIERDLRVYYLDLKKQNLNDAGEDDGFESRIDVAPRIGLFDRQFELDFGRWIRVWVDEIELRGPRN